MRLYQQLVQTGMQNFTNINDADVGSGWNLNVGDGSRTFTVEIFFDAPPLTAIAENMNVVLALNALDCSGDSGVRVGLQATDVNTNSFFLNITTWATTSILGIGVTYWIYADLDYLPVQS